MSEDIEFLKREIGRLQVEQVLAKSPLERLSLERQIEEAQEAINLFEGNVSQKPSPAKSKINAMHNPATNPSANPTNNIKPPDGISFRHFAFGVSVIIFAAVCLWAINHYLGIPL